MRCKTRGVACDAWFGGADGCLAGRAGAALFVWATAGLNGLAGVAGRWGCCPACFACGHFFSGGFM